MGNWLKPKMMSLAYAAQGHCGSSVNAGGNYKLKKENKTRDRTKMHDFSVIAGHMGHIWRKAHTQFLQKFRLLV